MKTLLQKIKQKYFNLILKLKDLDWTLIYLAIISFEISMFIFLRMHFFIKDIVVKDSLELILTINGLFSAILVSYFFNRVSRILDSKKEDYDEAVFFSQKITEFRRIAKVLTRYYGVWENDDVTKRLLESGKYKHVDYFDYKLSSFSDYEPAEKKLIEEMYADKNFHEGQSDLFLGLISLVEDRKANFKTYDSVLYKDFQKKGIYNYQFISNCVEIDYAGRLGYWFQKGYNFINYHRFSENSKREILSALERIDKKFLGVELSDAVMADLCDDMNEHYFKELLPLLSRLREGLSSISLLVYVILTLCLTIGVLFPMIVYFGFHDSETRRLLNEILVSLNFGLLLFFILSLYRLVKKEITWT